MKELVEIRFEDDRILLKENHVRSPILPHIATELDRDVVIQGECIIDGAVFARTVEIQQGPCCVRGAVFAHSEVHINSDARGDVFFEKAVGAVAAIVSLAPGCRLHILSDLTAKQVKLRNSYISGSIFADEIVLEDCVVLGGVFASNSAEINNCIVGTFNAPVVRVSRTVHLLFPSAFSVEKMSTIPGTCMYNLALADLGALMRGVEPLPNTGKIAMDFSNDELKAVLTGDGMQQIVRTYSVAGKVLAADLVDFDRLQNHFLLSCASLASQLLRTYDIGLDKDGSPIQLTPKRIASFFFDILDGKIAVPDLSGDFDIGSIVRGETPTAYRRTQKSESPAVGTPMQYETESPDSTSPITRPSVPEDVAEESGQEPSFEPNAPPISDVVKTLETSVERLCLHCKQPLDEGELFCGNCGKPQS